MANLSKGQIGNYIHYRWSHYKEYGIGSHGGKIGNGNAVGFMQQQKDTISSYTNSLARSYKNTTAKEELESYLNFFKNPQGKSANFLFTEQEKEEIEQIIEDCVVEKLSKFNAKIDFNTLVAQNVGSGAGVLDAQGQKLRNVGQQHDNIKVTTTDALVRRLIALETAYKDISANLKDATPEQKALLRNIDNLTKKYADVCESLGSYMEDGQNTARHTKISFKTVKGKNFVDELNNLWYMAKAHMTTNSYVSGKVGEYYAVFAAYASAAKAEGVSVDLIKQNLVNLAKGQINAGTRFVGSDRSAAVLLKANFAVQGVDLNEKHFQGGEYFSDFGGKTVKLSYTEDKVDCVFELPGCEKTINASIKNYSSGYDFHLLSGVSILGLTQEYGNFMNHYLNITATKDDREKDPGPGAPSSIIHLANQALILTIGMKALVGGRMSIQKGQTVATKSAEAQVFVVNDAKGYYHVYYVDDIINKVKFNIDNSIIVKGLDSGTTWDQEFIINKQKGDREYYNYNAAYSRINHLLAELHAFKLEVSLSRSLFKI